MKTKDMILASLMGALTAVGAWITIPIQPVPITFQIFFTVLAGILLGAKLGALSQGVYVLLGVIGLPVFSGGKAGLPHLFGPTGGYLVGFILAAYIIGRLTEKDRELKHVKTFLVLSLGLIVIYTLGMFQLAFVAKLDLSQAFMVGVAPFLILDGLKLVAATVIGVAVKKALVNAKLISIN